MDELRRELSRFSKYPAQQYSSIGELLQAAPVPGISTIAYGDGVLDLLFLDRGATTTIVVFHAAVPTNIETYPVFNALGVTAKLHANVLCVSDPSLARGVRLGWYVGNAGQALQSDLAAVIAHFRDASRGRQHLVLFGASGGGFAAIHYARSFPESLAIAINPQTDLARFHPAMVRKYLRVAWVLTASRTCQQSPASSTGSRIGRPSRICRTLRTASTSRTIWSHGWRRSRRMLACGCCCGHGAMVIVLRLRRLRARCSSMLLTQTGTGSGR